jgi:hypothetical protein
MHSVQFIASGGAELATEVTGSGTAVVWSDLDFPFIQERCRHGVATVPDAEGYEIPGVAHLAGPERPAEVTALVTGFIARRAN